MMENSYAVNIVEICSFAIIALSNVKQANTFFMQIHLLHGFHDSYIYIPGFYDRQIWYSHVL